MRKLALGFFLVVLLLFVFGCKKDSSRRVVNEVEALGLGDMDILPTEVWQNGVSEGLEVKVD